MEEKWRKYRVYPGALKRVMPLRERLKSRLSQSFEREKRRWSQVKGIFAFIRQNPKMAFTFFWRQSIRANARDFWLLLRDSLRTRWTRTIVWPVKTALWSPDGAYLVVGQNSELQLWNAHTGMLLRSFKVMANGERWWPGQEMEGTCF